MEVKIGDAITYVDEHRNPHNAIVITVHGDPNDNPTINLVFVSNDPDARDSYGRQIERKTSIVHESRTTATGMFWRSNV